MTTPRTKAQNSEKAFRRHRQRFTARTIHAVILSSQGDPSAGAMGRFYHMNYCRRVAIEASSSGDADTDALFDAHARLYFQSLMLHTEVNVTCVRGQCRSKETWSSKPWRPKQSDCRCTRRLTRSPQRRSVASLSASSLPLALARTTRLPRIQWVPSVSLRTLRRSPAAPPPCRQEVCVFTTHIYRLLSEGEIRIFRIPQSL